MLLLSVSVASGRPVLRLATGAALLLGALGLQACATVDAWERQKIYRPTSVASPVEWQSLLAQKPEIQTFDVPAATKGEQIAVLRLPARQANNSRVRVLYLHGTFRHALQNLAKAEPMRQAGLEVLMPDYRGWGASTPRLPSEQSIHEDAWSVWQVLQAEGHEQGEPVRWVVYGHSMGSAVAVQLAHRLRGSPGVCALVLESAFTSFAELAEDRAGWLGRLVTGLGSQRMASIDRMAQVDVPVWFLHGSLDRTVPLSLGRRLFERAPEPRHWRQWPMGHSNLQDEPSGGYARTWAEIAHSCGAP
jgi:pimeloyl-ACP methyl ester carboxylesterase